MAGREVSARVVPNGFGVVWREPCLDRAPARAAQSSGVHPKRSEVEQRGGANRMESQPDFLLAGWRMTIAKEEDGDKDEFK